MEPMKKEISAGGVVYRQIGDDFQILLIEDRYRKLAFAKGRMEAGETIEQAALREIKEETNIDGKIIQPLIINYYQFEHTEHGQVEKETHYYLVEALSGELKAQTEEIRGVKWHGAADVWAEHNLNGYENNRGILRMALEILGFLGEEDEMNV
ncbi:NTP pyrophosphohydrolase [Paenibacillus oryzisoli]|uniref:NTP pyrophosphohydrolase n=2 Tax=Paenibacillus oryzisoli TaxID=1850517 RepID=A0A198A6E3_9BACL|nr:NTP pyrophosphohydrolase [Paenibacillus oryzisoli]